jgi:hypothetical protein
MVHKVENEELGAQISALREMLHAALDQLHTAFGTIDRLHARLRDGAVSGCDLDRWVA